MNRGGGGVGETKKGRVEQLVEKARDEMNRGGGGGGRRRRW